MSEATMQLSDVKRLFGMLHGMYGSLLLDKFKTGDVDADGADRGVLQAQSIWLAGLRAFDSLTIRLALAKCADRHKTFPPTMPEFRDLCLSCAPRRELAPFGARIGMSDELHDQRREANRRALAEMRAKRSGDGQFQHGLTGLVAMVANAVGQAGGDEVGTLLRLESDFKRA